MLLGVICDPLWHKNYDRLVRNREAAGGEPGGSEPEYRLPPTIAGAFIVPIALFGTFFFLSKLCVGFVEIEGGEVGCCRPKMHAAMHTKGAYVRAGAARCIGGFFLHRAFGCPCGGVCVCVCMCMSLCLDSQSVRFSWRLFDRYFCM